MLPHCAQNSGDQVLQNSFWNWSYMIHPSSMRSLKKALHIVTNAKCLSFFIKEIPLLIFRITLSACCLKLSFSSSKIPKYFLCNILFTWILLRILDGWVWTWFFLKKNTSCVRLSGSGLKSIFQLSAYFEINKRSLLRTLTFSN